MVKRLCQELGSREGISKSEIKSACEAAYAELEAYRQEVRRKGQEILQEAERDGRHVILLAGRPYHMDPEINHGIPELITSFDIAVLTEDSISHLGTPERPLIVSEAAVALRASFSSAVRLRKVWNSAIRRR